MDTYSMYLKVGSGSRTSASLYSVRSPIRIVVYPHVHSVHWRLPNAMKQVKTTTAGQTS